MIIGTDAAPTAVNRAAQGERNRKGNKGWYKFMTACQLNPPFTAGPLTPRLLLQPLCQISRKDRAGVGVGPQRDVIDVLRPAAAAQLVEVLGQLLHVAFA